jgi:hypothetical protein
MLTVVHTALHAACSVPRIDKPQTDQTQADLEVAEDKLRDARQGSKAVSDKDLQAEALERKKRDLTAQVCWSCVPLHQVQVMARITDLFVCQPVCRALWISVDSPSCRQRKKCSTSTCFFAVRPVGEGARGGAS